MEILGNESLFLMPWREGAERHPVSQRMRAIAALRFYRNPDEREEILQEERADLLYCIKNGFNDGVLSRKVPTGIHAIFRESEFHGDIYAYVSRWLSGIMAYGQAPWVPHMVRLAETDEDLREVIGGRWPVGGDRKSVVGDRWPEVAIPKEATVFGRHGGDDSFDIPWVQRLVVETAKERPDTWFLFLNTREFRGAAGLPNIRFLPATADPVLKRRFLNTCDAMLHGRMRGETFGLSCLEFAMLGKPVLTFANSPEKAHLEILGDAAVRYESGKELKELLWDRSRWSVVGGRKVVVGGQCSEVCGRKAEAEAHRQPTTDYRLPSKLVDDKFKNFQPPAVMQKFQEVFLR